MLTLKKRLYNLTHDITILNLPGSALPIKVATMSRIKSKIRASYRSWARQCERIREWEMKFKENLYKSLRAVSVATTTGWAYLINGVTDRVIYKAYETLMGVVIRKILAHLINETKGMFCEMQTALATDKNIGSSCFHLRILRIKTNPTIVGMHKAEKNNKKRQKPGQITARLYRPV